MDAAWEMGITLFDTADAYGGGRSENADRCVASHEGSHEFASASFLTTKVFHSVVGEPSDRGLRRDRILRQIDGSLARLGVDRVDLYMIHEPDPRDAARRDARRARFSGARREGGRRSAPATSTAGGSGRPFASAPSDRWRGSTGCRTRSRCSTAKPRSDVLPCVPAKGSASHPSARSREAG